jgi:hypothetical protein
MPLARRLSGDDRPLMFVLCQSLSQSWGSRLGCGSRHSVFVKVASFERDRDCRMALITRASPMPIMYLSIAHKRVEALCEVIASKHSVSDRKRDVLWTRHYASRPNPGTTIRNCALNPAGLLTAASCQATPGALDICGGRYTVTAMMPAASMMRTMMGTCLMMGSYVTALTPSSAAASPHR